MTNLQIPYAYTNDKLPVSPEVAEKGQNFSCPICDSEVVLKRGEVRRPHFAHKPDTVCSGEGVRHKVAKQMIYLMYLKAVTHNLFHFNDQLYRIYCNECDDEVDHLEEDESMMEEDESIPEEVRAEILNEMDRQVPRLLAKELSSILQFHSKSGSEIANEKCDQSDK